MKNLKIVIVAGIIIFLVGLVSKSIFGCSSSVSNPQDPFNILGQSESDNSESTNNLTDDGCFNYFAIVTNRYTSTDGLNEYVGLEALDTIKIGEAEIPVRNHHALFDENLQKEYFKYSIKAFPHKYASLRERAFKGGSVEYKFTDRKNNELLKWKLSDSELRELFNTFISEDEAKEKILEIFATQISSLMAGYRQDFVKFNKAYYNGSSFILELSVDEKRIDMNKVKLNRKEIEKDINRRDGLPFLDKTPEGVLDHLLNELDKKLVYRYKGNRTGKYVDININI